MYFTPCTVSVLNCCLQREQEYPWKNADTRMPGGSRSSCDRPAGCQLVRLSTCSCLRQPAISGELELLIPGLNLGHHFSLNIFDDYPLHLLMRSAQHGGIYRHDVAANGEGAWL